MLLRQGSRACRAHTSKLQQLFSLVSLPPSATPVNSTHVSLGPTMSVNSLATDVHLASTSCRHLPCTWHIQRRCARSAATIASLDSCQHSMHSALGSATWRRQLHTQNMRQSQLIQTHAAPTGDLAAQQPLDAIHIKGARFYGYHGVLPAENAVGQPFVVDVSLYLDLQAAGTTDNLQHTVSYADVFEQVRQVMEGPPHQLLESLAHKIALNVLVAHTMVYAIRISISKCHIPKLSAAVSSVGVEVYRTRSHFNLQATQRKES